MADLNDYKLVALKSKKMFDYLKAKRGDECDDTQKSRLGFYYLVLENITGIRDVDEIQNLIIDTDYNKYISDEVVDDLGIDAVNIIGDDDSDESIVQLFSFKYRGSFNPDRTMEENCLDKSKKYLEYLQCESDEFDKLPKDKVEDSLEKVRKLIYSNKICNLVLYVISNEANGFNVKTNKIINVFEKNYGMKIKTISLDDIVGYFVPCRSEKTSQFIVSPNDFLSFEMDSSTTQKSYILKMSLLDLIRITCVDTELGKNYSMEDDTRLIGAKLDFGLLYDNVRGYLGETNYNANIIETLKHNYKEFFMLNNGLTMTASGVDAEKKNSGNRYLFTIQDFQIVNGGQTIRSIYNYLDSEADNSIQNLRETSVLVRIFKIPAESELKNRIAEYTNSQNAISNSDLKSVDEIQIQLENYLKEEKILYIRKSGQLGEDATTYDIRISKEKVAQILYSAYGFPDRASNQKKRLFGKYYDEVFKGEKFSLENTIECIRLYYQIESEYKKHDHYDYFELKNYYVIYLIKNFKLSIENAIQLLEKTIKDDTENITQARLLLKNKFKQSLDKNVNA
jgi:hypothetical protein